MISWLVETAMVFVDAGGIGRPPFYSPINFERRAISAFCSATSSITGRCASVRSAAIPASRAPASKINPSKSRTAATESARVLSSRDSMRCACTQSSLPGELPAACTAMTCTAANAPWYAPCAVLCRACSASAFAANSPDNIDGVAADSMDADIGASAS